MDKFFETVGKLSHKQSREIAALCASAALLLLVAAGIAGGGVGKVNHLLATAGIISSSQTACVFPCNNSAFDMEALIPMQGGSPVSTVLPGSPINWQWNAGAYGASHFTRVCAGSQAGPDYMCTVQINTPNTNFGACSYPTKGCTGGYGTVCGKNGCTQQCLATGYIYDYAHCGNADDTYGSACFGPNGGYVATGFQPQCQFQSNGGSGYEGNYPASTLTLNAPSTPGTYTYYFCSNWLLHANAHNGSLTPLSCMGTSVTVANPAVSADATSNSPVNVGQSAIISFHADSSLPPTQCQINNFDDSLALKNVAGCPSSANASYTTQIFTVPGTYAYKFYYYQGSWTLVKTVNITVNAVATACANGLGSSFQPSCVCPSGQMQSGATCVAGTICPNGLASSFRPSCTCPSGQVQSGSTCVAAPACANGLGSSYQPSCTCPSGQVQSGAACIPAPACANGLGSSYQPSCTCPSGQIQSGSLCVAAPSCANGLASSYAPSCTCPSGQVQFPAGGLACVLQGSIQSFTAIPNRVLKGKTATITWSTTNMTSCSLSKLDSAGNSTLLSAKNGTLTPVINSKTIFTLSCSDATGAVPPVSQTVNLIPQTIEQ